tara:strand:- start:130 stop:642 length:513 start_codon:yes stop_codon:yes gene_type:complete
MLRKDFLMIVLSGLIGFCLGFFCKIALEQNKFILAEWKEDPIIIVCPDSEITPYRVQLAVDWWGIRGHNFSYVHWDNNNQICSKGTFMKGMIFIRANGDLIPNTYAITARLSLGGRMQSATITLPNKHKYMPRLLEHELGHTLGFTHVEKIGHMMHPIHEYGGEKFWIPD